MHRGIRVPYQRVGVCAIIGGERNADTHTDMQRIGAYTEWLFERERDGLGDERGLCLVGMVGDRDKFIAAKAREKCF